VQKTQDGSNGISSKNTNFSYGLKEKKDNDNLDAVIKKPNKGLKHTPLSLCIFSKSSQQNNTKKNVSFANKHS